MGAGAHFMHTDERTGAYKHTEGKKITRISEENAHCQSSAHCTPTDLKQRRQERLKQH